MQATQPDVVVVAGPDHLHADQSVMALEQGCHVLIEKPLATKVADARRILDAQARNGSESSDCRISSCMIHFCQYDEERGSLNRHANGRSIATNILLVLT